MITKADIKLTPAEWCELAQVEIIDPDGWTFHTSTGVRARAFSFPITWDEFVDRMNASTIKMNGSLSHIEEIVFGRLFLS